MAADPIPVLSVSGSHRQVGQQIGAARRMHLNRLLDRVRLELPPGLGWDWAVGRVRPYLDCSRAALPEYVTELAGIAEGADLPLDHLFVAMCEELFEPSPGSGCTDLAARGRATVDGSTLVAHTNDLGPETEEELVILRVQAADEPEFLAVSVGGLGLSAGLNTAGISLTGNQVSSTDVRIGVPRLLVVRAILAARTLGEAMDTCLLPQRASSYNNIIADANGEVYSMEGAATDCEPLYIEDDLLAHANHYISPAMRDKEADRNAIGSSVIRQHRAMRLLRENRGGLSPDLFRQLLADHANYPASICKHGIESVTVFAVIICVEDRRVWIGRGRPCQTIWHEHQLERWSGTPDGVLV
jgi:isopenicillin-N N-acyltransferase-like protein